MRFVSVHVVHPYSSIGTAITVKKSRYISLDRSDFFIIDFLSIAVYTFTRRALISLSLDENVLLKFDRWLRPYCLVSDSFVVSFRLLSS